MLCRGVRWLGAGAVAVLSGCGGGGGYGGGGGGGPSSALYVSSLAGSNETTVVDASAHGIALVRVGDDVDVDRGGDPRHSRQLLRGRAHDGRGRGSCSRPDARGRIAPGSLATA